MSILPVAKQAGKVAGRNFLGIGGGKLATSLGVAGAGAILAPPILSSLTNQSGQARIREIRARQGASPHDPLSTAMRIRKMMQENEARLAALEPHTYAELVAGRKLARGSRVYGASATRSEQLEQALYRMTTGQIGVQE